MAVEFTLLLDLALIIIFATIIGYLIKVLKQPSLVGYIVAGLLIGPAGLGALNLHFGGFPIGLGPEQIENIRILSELGVAFLLFSIGVETDFSRMFDLRKTLFVGGLLHIFVIFLTSFFATTLLGIDVIQSIFIGFVLAFSSTMMVVKMLSDKHEINTIEGRLMIGFLLIEDIFIILVLPLLQHVEKVISLSVVWNVVGSAIVLFGAAFLLNKFVLKKVMGFVSKSNELFYLTNLSIAFGFIGIAYMLDFSIAIGAFVGGLALSNLPHNLEILGNIRGLRDFFLTIFFVTLGMQLSFQFTGFPVIFLILALAVIYLLKPLIFFLITFLAGYGARIAFFVALGLAQVSEFSFILLNQGYAGGTGPISQSFYSLLVLIITVSMASTPYLMNYSNPLYNRFKALVIRLGLKRLFMKRNKLDELQKLPKEGKGFRVVLVGCGALGGNIVKVLKDDYKLVVVDHNPDVIINLIKQGIPAVCGSTQNEEIWHKINLKETDLLIITVPELEEALFLTDYARDLNEKIVIFVRAHYFEGALKLYELGADLVVLPEILASNSFLQSLSTYLKKKDLSAVTKFKDEYLEYLKEKAAEEKMTYKV